MVTITALFACKHATHQIEKAPIQNGREGQRELQLVLVPELRRVPKFKLVASATCLRLCLGPYVSAVFEGIAAVVLPNWIDLERIIYEPARYWPSHARLERFTPTPN